MVKFSIQISILIFFIGFKVQAQPNADLLKKNCKDVRLDIGNGPFAQIPIYDQKKFDGKTDAQSNASFNKIDISASGENLCYAISACQLIDARRAQHGDSLKQLCSPISLALNHKTNFSSITDMQLKGSGIDKQSENASVIGPGNAPLAMMSNSGRPICNQRWLEKYASLFSGGESEEIPNDPNGHSVRSFFTATFDQIDQIEALDDSLRLKDGALNNYFKCNVDSKTSNLEDIVAAARAALRAAEPIPRAQIFLEKLCKENSFSTQIPQPTFYNGIEKSLDKPLNDAAWAAVEGRARDEIVEKIKNIRAGRRIEKISSLLNGSPPTPVGIGYVHEMLRWKGLGGWADHTSVVIGQRWNGKSCEYLLRDSFGGKNCQDSIYPCDNGSFWVPQEALQEATSSIYWIP